MLPAEKPSAVSGLYGSTCDDKLLACLPRLIGPDEVRWGGILCNSQQCRLTSKLLQVCDIRPSQRLAVGLCQIISQLVLPAVLLAALYCLQSVGTVLPEVADLLGLGHDVVVAPGSGDNAMSALGSGVTQ
jgi:hypothetical protein